MKHPPEINLKAVRRVAFFHMNSLGDLVFSLPALEAVRDRFPGAEIWSVTRPNLAPLLDASPLVDVVLARGRGAGAAASVAWRLRRAGVDVTINISRSPGMATLALLSGARTRLGFLTASFQPVWTHRAEWVPPNSIANNLRLVGLLGAELNSTAPTQRLVSTGQAKQRAADLLRAHGVTAGFVVAARQASTPFKEWPEEFWTESMRQLGRDLPVVLVGLPTPGTGDPAAGEIDLRGKTDLETLAALCELADLCVGVDSGVLHLAAAVGTPVVGIFGPTDWRATGPFPDIPQRLVHLGIECSPCLLTRCRWNGDDERRCMTGLQPQQVVTAARELLAG